MIKYFLLVALLNLNFIYSFSQTIERPREAWVFRSVLDGRPKIITIGLHKDLWVGYDPVNCGIFKIWKDGINFDGAVYTTKHGPQPTTIGRVYTDGIIDNQIWTVQKDGKLISSKTLYKGYVWRNNKVTLMYDIQCEGKTISIEESPEFTFREKDNSVGLERKFKASNVPGGYQVVVDLKLNPMLSKKDMVTDSEFKLVEKREYFYSWGNPFVLRGNFYLRPNQSTTLVTYFSPKVIQ